MYLIFLTNYILQHILLLVELVVVNGFLCKIGKVNKIFMIS